ncbi:tetratricopeptide repeat protein [Pseudoalteromonas elyakovii]|nr:tetratricopeptide repeat protein [Pseudoalteromonas elyakovii]
MFIQNNSSSSKTNKDVFALRKAGKIDEAYNLAIELINSSPNDEWNVKAFAWCLIDLVKRDAKLGNNNTTNHYLQQLDSLSIDPSDEILNKQVLYVRNMASPIFKETQRAKQASKEGKYQLAINIYTKALSEQPDNQDIRSSIGWEIYKLAKAQFNNENVNVFALKKLLNDYLKLNCNVPSLLHSLFLGLADKLTSHHNFNLAAFIKIWGIQNLRDEDFEPYVDDVTGNSYPSLASKVALHGTKQAVEHNDLEYLPLLLEVIDRVIPSSDDPIWLDLNKARALNLLGEYQKSFDLAVKVAKQKIGEYWIWELLGDIQGNYDKSSAFNCYCRALSSNPKENFIANLRLKLAELLIEQGNYSAAKYEVTCVMDARNREGWSIPEKAEMLQSQSWFSATEVAASNQSLYKEHAGKAEEVLFQNLPWIHANLGSVFSLPDKPNKKRRKIYLKNSEDRFPVEITLPENRFSFSSLSEGAAVRFKGELDRITNRFTAYQFETRTTANQWDIFSSFIGVVDHVNVAKKLVHVIFDRGIDTVIPFSKTPGRLSVGDSVKAKLSKSKTKHGTKYQALTITKSDEKASTNVLKEFSDDVRISNGLGFTSTDIFIDRNLVEDCDVEDGDTVSGKAVLNYNKKRSSWGWKVIAINNKERF